MGQMITPFFRCTLHTQFITYTNQYGFAFVKFSDIYFHHTQFRKKEIISAIDLKFSSNSHIEYRTRIHWTEFRYIHIHIIIFIQKLPIDLSRFNGKTVHKSTFYRNYMYTCTGETMFVDLFWLLFDTLKLFALLFPTLATNFPCLLGNIKNERQTVNNRLLNVSNSSQLMRY